MNDDEERNQSKIQSQGHDLFSQLQSKLGAYQEMQNLQELNN